MDGWRNGDGAGWRWREVGMEGEMEGRKGETLRRLGGRMRDGERDDEREMRRQRKREVNGE